MHRPSVRTTIAALIAGLLATLTLGAGLNAPADAAGNVVTPGDFTGYGFDQCLAPNQRDMNAWLGHSPFLAVGIYISGDSRACRNQPNLTTTWVSTQLTRGWRLLAITLGPQASCNPRFPRYGNDVTINPTPGRSSHYGIARRQGTAEATKTVDAAKALGISPGSTMWYDLEGFDLGNTNCRESALAFLSTWTGQIHALGYVSGVYSSGGSGIKMLDDARVNRPDAFDLPDQVWVARWDGVASTSTSYLRDDAWQPHARVKQYQGGHDETWGGVRINIDRDFLDLGRGSVAAPESHCNGVKVSFWKYPVLRPGTGSTDRVKALQCLLKEHHLYGGRINGSYSPAVVTAVRTWQQQHAFPVRNAWTKPNWISLLVDGPAQVLKYGSAGGTVRRVQRALNAADATAHLSTSGVFDTRTDQVLRAWQKRVGLEASGVAASPTWRALRKGLR